MKENYVLFSQLLLSITRNFLGKSGAWYLLETVMGLHITSLLLCAGVLSVLNLLRSFSCSHRFMNPLLHIPIFYTCFLSFSELSLLFMQRYSSSKQPMCPLPTYTFITKKTNEILWSYWLLKNWLTDGWI